MSARRAHNERSITTAALLCATIFALTACSNDPGEPTVKPSRAEQSVVEFVEQSSAAAGGEWEHVSGPGVRECAQENGAPGTMFVYIVKRADSTDADARADVRAVGERWKDLGVDVEWYESGGADPVPGVRGRGGPVISASFNAKPGNYRLSATSQCSDGSPDELSREG
ncbi:hypothetical protein NY588_08210 [Curtobacterium flaccumfaciens pv. beticola]|uniref:hypothetical protein n=1 Tax=Curtobacterium flaccumfaciens TaxID=2035 RepID=UPI00349F80BC|nr:hypothetical protein [Curtobacterium flaccumfaciens pv. basellae]